MVSICLKWGTGFIRIVSIVAYGLYSIMFATTGNLSHDTDSDGMLCDLS